MVKEEEEGKLIIGGDFNARIGQEGSIFQIEKKNAQRKSKDKVKNKEGEILLELTEGKGWDILNGNTEGDEEGEFTYVSQRGNSVIDYVLTNVDAREEIWNFKIEERVESDHMPVVVELYKTGRREHREEEKWRENRIWSDEGKKEYQDNLEKTEFTKEDVNEMVDELIEKINKAVKKK